MESANRQSRRQVLENFSISPFVVEVHGSRFLFESVKHFGVDCSCVCAWVARSCDLQARHLECNSVATTLLAQECVTR